MNFTGGEMPNHAGPPIPGPFGPETQTPEAAFFCVKGGGGGGGSKVQSKKLIDRHPSILFTPAKLENLPKSKNSAIER